MVAIGYLSKKKYIPISEYKKYLNVFNVLMS